MDLKTWRYNAGLTQEALAAAIGCEPSTISRIENGGRTPAPKLCGAIFRLTNGAVTAQDHQAAWESAQARKAERLRRRAEVMCRPGGDLPMAVPSMAVSSMAAA